MADERDWKDEFRGWWWRYRMEAELARQYATIAAFFAMPPVVRRNPVLELLLPSSLLVRAVALLDAGCKLALSRSGVAAPAKRYRNNLAGRLEHLHDVDAFDAALYAQLGRIRSDRNLLAHESSAAFGWDQLQSDIEAIEQALIALDLVALTQKLQIYASRSKGKELPNGKYQFDYRYGVKSEDGTHWGAEWAETRGLFDTE